MQAFADRKAVSETLQTGCAALLRLCLALLCCRLVGRFGKMCLTVYEAAVFYKLIRRRVLHTPSVWRLTWTEHTTVRWGTCRLATFYSRSRKGRWCKGETSGHYINVLSMHPDCDRDSLVYLSSPIGPACHTARCIAHCCLGMLYLMEISCSAAAQSISWK